MSISHLVPQNMKVKKPENGIFVHLYMLYNAGDSQDLVTVKFPLSEEGKKDSEFFINMLAATAAQMQNGSGLSPEQIAKNVSTELGIELNKTTNLINKISMSDGNDEEGYAIPYRYYVEVVKNENVVKTIIEYVEK